MFANVESTTYGSVMLAIAGTLMSGCMWLILFSLAYIFTGSQMLFTVILLRILFDFEYD